MQNINEDKLNALLGKMDLGLRQEKVESGMKYCKEVFPILDERPKLHSI